jgi:tetratricopeptide (TPR) repeat protein
MLAAFRSPVDFETTKAIFDIAPQQSVGLGAAIRRFFQRHEIPLDLKSGLKELVDRGLLFFDREQARYDMHPVVRGYAYDRLADKPVVHIRLYGYFVAFPTLERDKVQSLDDLRPTIELYHHTVRAGRYDEAFELFRDQIGDPLYFRLGAYQTCIELLLALFLDGDDRPPRLKDEGDQAWALNALANSYSLSGQPRRAVPLYETSVAINEKQGAKVNLAIGLKAVAEAAYIATGKLAVAEVNLRRSIALCREIEDEFREAVGHQELGRLLAYQGMLEEAEQS